MATPIEPDYAALDRPEVRAVLFHPRREMDPGPSDLHGCDLDIPVGEGITVGARFHLAGKANPNILFFHGNGEIVADYDEIGPLFTRLGLNFLPVDYRGYGRSTGSPSVTAMLADARVIFDFVGDWLEFRGYTGPIIVMGRSLGSASVLDLVASRGEKIAGLIVESGFAYITPLLRLLGVDPDAIGFNPEWDAFNLANIQTFTQPTLIIHAQYDHIISFSEGQALHDASPAGEKRLVMIPGANHSDIFYRGMNDYLQAVQWLAESARSR